MPEAVRLFLLILVFCLASCSIFPETKESLLGSGKKSPEYCLNQERELVEQRIERYLASCFGYSQVSVGNGTRFTMEYRVRKERSFNQTEYSVFSPSGTGAGYFLNVIVAGRQSACASRLFGTAYNFMWALKFEDLKKSAVGETVSCFF
ncbi:hypothetical protein [Pseudomonas huaxiensis]|uniref:hypothetical protein n=1 Tax=Pseudomonas huaxiensis TaxID=2213017 RepID=UPI00130057A8|nr:hypothetical protein [Pseudomonas huaxiensis]